MLEVYVNGRPITERLYPASDSQAVDVFAEGGQVRVESIDVWQMKSICRVRKAATAGRAKSVGWAAEQVGPGQRLRATPTSNTNRTNWLG